MRRDDASATTPEYLHFYLDQLYLYPLSYHTTISPSQPMAAVFAEQD